MNTTVSTITTTGPTQELRNLIDDVRGGQASADDMHRALMELEVTLSLPLTQPEGTL